MLLLLLLSASASSSTAAASSTSEPAAVTSAATAAMGRLLLMEVGRSVQLMLLMLRLLLRMRVMSVMRSSCRVLLLSPMLLLHFRLRMQSQLFQFAHHLSLAHRVGGHRRHGLSTDRASSSAKQEAGQRN